MSSTAPLHVAEILDEALGDLLDDVAFAGLVDEVVADLDARLAIAEGV